MPQLTIPDIEDATLRNLEQRAYNHGRTAPAEARAILEDALRGPEQAVWERVNEFRERLAKSGRTFGDSTELVREDRDR